jgi:hypothetical protein
VKGVLTNRPGAAYNGVNIADIPYRLAFIAVDLKWQNSYLEFQKANINRMHRAHE